MNAPLTPPDPPSNGSSDYEAPWPPPPGDGGTDHRAELRRAAWVALGVTVAGVLLGLLWLWLAPKIPLVSNGKVVYFQNTEGEEAIGADGTFVLLALGFGVISGAVVFLCARSGGVALVVALALGGVLASVIAWRFGIAFGPDNDVARHARQVGKGVVFDAPLELRAKGALLVWPLAAMAVHLALTGFFTPRDPEPEQPLPAGAWPRS
ncbi:hypothetical protein [Streptomyces sp. TP-A0874]|uniref:hypothetical protein n=1 Tax=Streptomyces sp. TP-A0874 TaxID=549819 RepID=UPI000852E998|nr:hypothetical protein [Streptomyces sp. TP-A0874]